MVAKKGAALPGRKPVKKAETDMQKLERQLSGLNAEEMKELLLMTMYKMALVRSQLDAITDILVQKKLVTRERLWKETRDRFADPQL